MTSLDGVQAAINSEQNSTKTIEQAIVEARATCEQNGNNSSNCSVAWDIVEELQAEKADQKRTQHRKTSLESYCEMYPDALECLVYDV